MLRSLFSGVTGLRNHQLRLDVIGNNVANVNTIAFKSGRVAFKEGYAQLVSGATRPPGDQGGVNPVQVGLGSQVASVDTLFSQGNLESTGLSTDMAIQGQSFFTVAKGNQFFYTRSGNFQLDGEGRMVSPANGFVVQGRVAINGVFQDGVRDITLPFGQKTAALATTNVTLAGNLDAASQVFNQGTAAVLDPLDPTQRAVTGNERSYKDVSITVFDSLGEEHELKVVAYKTGPSQWSWQVDPTGLDIDLTFGTGGIQVNAGTNPFVFLNDGTLDIDPATFIPPQITFRPNSGAADVTITIDPRGAGVNGLSQFAGSHNSVLRDQDGYTSGTLTNFSIDRLGTIVGAFTNGTTSPLGQIVLADFNNPGGLLRVGDNMYSTSGNSGSAVLGFAGEASQSQMVSGALEMSNVDLAQEFTSMIVAERGYQANSRVITTSDRLLEELVSLKR